MFNIRVYGILIDDERRVLVSDEYIRGQYYTKFVGGGMEIGEGSIDCLIREFKEEMNLRIKVLDHFYTTDFYQQSAFNPQHQIVSLYYTVQPLEPIAVPVNTEAFLFSDEQMQKYRQQGETECFRWIAAQHFDENSVTLPIDKVVAGKIKQQLLSL